MCQPLAFFQPLDQPQLRTGPAFAIGERNRLARAQSAASFAENPPVAVRRRFDKQPVPAAAGACPVARQLGRYHLRVVQNQPVAGRQQMRQIADMVVLDLLPMAVDDHQPGVCAMAERLLGDQLPGHFVVEWEGVGERHDGLNRRTDATRTPPLPGTCLTVHCQPGINFKSRFVAPPNPTTDLCLEIQRRYCTCDHKPRGKTRLTSPPERLFFSIRGLICWSLDLSD